MIEQAVRERPILFSGAMIRAILAGQKTQTRRIVKPSQSTPKVPPLMMEPWLIDGEQETDDDGVPCWAGYHHEYPTGQKWFSCPYGKPGDVLWVRETWRRSESGMPDGVVYRADNLLRWFDGTDMRVNEMSKSLPRDGKWRPSIFMSKWASRITLRITDVRVQQLQEISEDDATAEGVDRGAEPIVGARYAFGQLWNSINGKTYPWELNPWVWALALERINQ